MHGLDGIGIVLGPAVDLGQEAEQLLAPALVLGEGGLDGRHGIGNPLQGLVHRGELDSGIDKIPAIGGDAFELARGALAISHTVVRESQVEPHTLVVGPLHLSEAESRDRILQVAQFVVDQGQLHAGHRGRRFPEAKAFELRTRPPRDRADPNGITRAACRPIRSPDRP